MSGTGGMGGLSGVADEDEDGAHTGEGSGPERANGWVRRPPHPRPRSSDWDSVALVYCTGMCCSGVVVVRLISFMVLQVLDRTGDGKVTMADLERRYDASRHPDVVAGIKSSRMVGRGPERQPGGLKASDPGKRWH